MTNYNLYRIFYFVALEKNISKASEKLFISQPAISSSVKELENTLNQTLFVRKNKGVELTPFGKILFERVKPIIDSLNDIENLSQNFNDIKTGTLKIGCSSSNINQILLNYLSKFVEEYPKIKILMTRGSNEFLLSELEKNNLDIIFTDENKKFNDLTLIKEFDIKYQLVGNKKYKKLYSEKDIAIDHFPINDLILPSLNNKSRLSINEFFAKNNILLMPKYELDNYILLFDFVKKGYGIAFVNMNYYQDNIQRGEVEVIYPNFILTAKKIVCLTNNEIINPALDSFIDIIKKNDKK